MSKKIILLCTIFFGLLQIQAQNISLLNVDLNRYSLRSVSNPISFTIKNNGDTAISSLELNWNDGVSHKAKVETHIPAGETAVIAHPVPVEYNSVLEKSIEVSVSKVNGNNNFIGNTASSVVKINTLTRAAKKAVFFEKATGTWCGNCPAGIVIFKELYKKHKGTFVGVAIHGGGRDEPMEFASYLKSTRLNRFPTGDVDRVKRDQVFMDRAVTNNLYNERIKVEAPADLSASVVADGAKIEVKTKAKFYSDFSSAKFKFSVVLTEDNVTGTSSGYNQANYYATRGQEMGGFENKPNPVPAKDMVYNHVARALMGGYDGEEGSIPSTIKSGQEVEYTFNHTLPKEETKNYNLVIVLIDGSNGNVVNVKEVKLDEALSVGKVDATFSSLKMYPNPANAQLNIAFEALSKNYTVTIYDMVGREVLKQNYTTTLGKQKLEVSTSKLKSGSYIASVSSGKSSYSQVVIIE